MADIDWITLGPMVAKIFADFLAAERSRTGLTDEEIFERAGTKWDTATANLLADLQRLEGGQP